MARAGAGRGRVTGGGAGVAVTRAGVGRGRVTGRAAGAAVARAGAGRGRVTGRAAGAAVARAGAGRGRVTGGGAGVAVAGRPPAASPRSTVHSTGRGGGMSRRPRPSQKRKGRGRVDGVKAGGERSGEKRRAEEKSSEARAGGWPPYPQTPPGVTGRPAIARRWGLGACGPQAFGQGPAEPVVELVRHWTHPA